MITSSITRDLTRNPTQGKFQPKDLQGLVLHCRNQRGITNTGLGVSQWDDVSGQGNHLKQATDTNRPLIGDIASDIITNGDFATDTIWTKQTGWTISGGVGVGTSVPAFTSIFQTVSFSDNKFYRVTFDVVTVTAGGVLPIFFGNVLVIGTERTGTGTFTEILNSNNGNNLFLLQAGSSGFSGTIDNVLVESFDYPSGILFDGVDNYLKADVFTLVQPETVYILGKQVTWTITDNWFDGDTASTGLLQQVTSTPQVAASADIQSSTISPTLDTYVVISVVFNGANSVLQLNDDTPITGDFGADNLDGFTLGAIGGGASGWGNIQIKEVIIYNTAHDSNTRLKVIEYLSFVGNL